jgi:hypothetical protein
MGTAKSTDTGPVNWHITPQRIVATLTNTTSNRAQPESRTRTVMPPIPSCLCSPDLTLDHSGQPLLNSSSPRECSGEQTHVKDSHARIANAEQSEGFHTGPQIARRQFVGRTVVSSDRCLQSKGHHGPPPRAAPIRASRREKPRTGLPAAVVLPQR